MDKTEVPGLLPCPFCGKTPMEDEYGEAGCCNPDCRPMHEDPVSAPSWNTRSIHAAALTLRAYVEGGITKNVANAAFWGSTLSRHRPGGDERKGDELRAMLDAIIKETRNG